MALAHPLHMETTNHRRRHKRLRDFLTLMTLGGLVAGCEANAKDEAVKAQTPPEVIKLTVGECAAIMVQADMIDCFHKLKVQQDAEIAALDAKEEMVDVENAELDKNIALGNTTVEVLSKEAEASMQRLEDRVLGPER